MTYYEKTETTISTMRACVTAFPKDKLNESVASGTRNLIKSF